MPVYTFSGQEAAAAHQEWGCNCGPMALAFAFQTTLEAVRYAIRQFDERRYTNPTMMREAIAFLGHRVAIIRGPFRDRHFQRGVDAMFAGPLSLVRVQWTGPWTAVGMRARWAATHTHWIATWSERGVPLVFDGNRGIKGFELWDNETVQEITRAIPRADGGWFAANVWRCIANARAEGGA